MKRLISEQLIPGMITAEDVYNLSGQLLVPRGTALTDSMISMILSYAIHSIRIDDTAKAVDTGIEDLELPEKTPKASPVDMDFSDNVNSPASKEAPSANASDPVSKEASSTDDSSPVLKEAARQRKEELKQFKASYTQNLDSFKTSISDIVKKNSDLNISDMLQQTLSLLNPAKRTINVLDMLLHMREYDDSIYAHSVNVALTCNVLAGWLHFSEQDRILATACGLFHDVGKMTIPEDILQKPQRLNSSELSIVHMHTEKGYELLSGYQLHDSIKKSALMHHEKCDGSGYPHKLRGSQIDRFAKLVAICDIYNAMTTDRSYRKAFSPFYVIDSFESEGLQKYDTRYILVFLENVVNTYLNCRVQLNNGMEGVVVFINPGRIGKPTIQCGREFIDLSKRTDLFIEKML